MSAKQAVATVAAARDDGWNVFGETCPQYLYLSLEEHLSAPGFEGAKYVCSTPLRARAEGHQDELWKSLRTNDLSVVSTDHCPFCFKEQKELGLDDFSKIPNGIGGVEHRMDLIYQGVVDGRISLAALGGAVRDHAGAHVRPLPAQGRHRAGLGRRRRGLRPERDDDDQRRHAPHEHGLLRVRRHGDPGRGRHRALARQGRSCSDGEYIGTKGHGRYLRRGACEYLDMSTRRIDHWIGGKRCRRVGPHGAGLRPRDRRGSRPRSASRASRRSTTRSRPRPEAFRRGGVRRCRARTEVHVPLPAPPRRAPRRDRGRALGGARQGAVRRRGRGRARGIENVEFACGIPALLKGGFSEQVATGVDVHSVRQPLGVVAGITPFNFPAMVPLWMFADRHRVRQHVRAEAEREGSVARRCCWPSCSPRRVCPTACSTSCTATRSRSTACSSTPDVAAVSFVGSTPIARHVYETGTAHGKRVQALGGAKNHMVVLPDADIDVAADAAVSAGVRLGRRALHGDLGRRRGRRRRRSARATRSRARCRSCASGPAPIRTSEMGPLITREHRDRVASYLDDAPTTARTSSSTGASRRSTATASSSACRSSTT